MYRLFILVVFKVIDLRNSVLSQNYPMDRLDASTSQVLFAVLSDTDFQDETRHQKSVGPLAMHICGRSLWHAVYFPRTRVCVSKPYPTHGPDEAGLILNMNRDI